MQVFSREPDRLHEDCLGRERMHLSASYNSIHVHNHTIDVYTW